MVWSKDAGDELLEIVSYYKGRAGKNIAKNIYTRKKTMQYGAAPSGGVPLRGQLKFSLKLQKVGIDKEETMCITIKRGKIMLEIIGISIPVIALSIPIIALTLSYKQKTQKNKIRELELQKEILALEIEKQDGHIKLLEEENKKYDKLINE
jgi:hypothetical protein